MKRLLGFLMVLTLLANLAIFLPLIHSVQAMEDHDVSIRNISIDCSVTWYGSPSEISVAIANDGLYEETVNVTIYANDVVIREFDEIPLGLGEIVTVTLFWDGHSAGSDLLPSGAYAISAFVHPIEGEIDTSDNTYFGKIMKVTIAGDVNGDGKVNVLDLIRVSINNGRTVPWPGMVLPLQWRIDLDNNGKVDVLDIALVSLLIYYYSFQR